MANDWRVAAHVDLDDVLELATPAATVLAGLGFDWQWVILRDGQRFYALTRKELVGLIDASRRKAPDAGIEPDSPPGPLSDLLVASRFPPALMVDHDLWFQEIAGLPEGAAGGSQARIIARVAGAPLVIWARVNDGYSEIDGASPDGSWTPPSIRAPARITRDVTVGSDRDSSVTERPGAAGSPKRAMRPPAPSRDVPPAESPPRRTFGQDHGFAGGGMGGAADDAELPGAVEMEVRQDPDAVDAAAGAGLETAAAGQIPAEEVAPEEEPPPGALDEVVEPEAAAPDEVEPTRWVDAEIEDHVAAEPLVVAETYTLAISINSAALQSSESVGRVPAAPLTRDPDKALQLTISLSSNDFTISDPERRLKIGKDGLSAGKARFDIAPVRAGLGRLTAILHRDNNFVQRLDISLHVGPGVTEPASVVSTGRPIAASGNLSRRDVGLSIRPSPNGGFDCTVWGVTAGEVKLPIRAEELATEIDAARSALLRVVNAKTRDGTRPFQDDVEIKEGAMRDTALSSIALAGYRLFQSLFFHPAADRQCHALGEWLIEQLDREQDDFKLQIVARDFPVPWAMLYLVPEWKDDAIDFERFLGMKLVVEQIPLCNDRFNRDPRIPGDPGGLSVSLNLNTDIGMGGVVAAQEAYWSQKVAACPAIRLRKRTLATEVIDALNDSTTDDQIVYFFCHAESLGLTDGGPGGSNLTMSDHGSLDLAELAVRAPAKRKLGGAPLVFINACESAKLSPLFYNGFVPYFLSKGACGVIGTECKVPGRFAEAWAREFFNAFLAGRPIGEIVRLLRRSFYQSQGNPLGLLYGLYCNADTQINPLPVRQGV